MIVKTKECQAFLLEFGLTLAGRRKHLNVRQCDLAKSIGSGTSRLSHIENGADLKLSTLYHILDRLGVVEQFKGCLLEAIGIETITQRVKLPSSPNLDPSKPLTVSQFERIIDNHPNMDIPVRTRSAYELRRRGFAIRQQLMNSLGMVSVATTIEAAQYSEHLYHTEQGEIGGLTHITVELGKSLLYPEQIDSLAFSDEIRGRMNRELLSYNVYVSAVSINSNGTKHKAYKNNKVLKTLMVMDIIDECLSQTEELTPVAGQDINQ